MDNLNTNIRQITRFCQAVIVTTFVALVAYGIAQEKLGKSQQKLVGGGVTSLRLQEDLGLLNLSDSCSATLLNNDWAITAAHCVEKMGARGFTPDTNRPGQNLLDPIDSQFLKAAWIPKQERKIIDVVTFRPYDIAIVRASEPFKVHGTTTGYSRPVYDTSLTPDAAKLAGLDILSFGRGIYQLATGEGDSAVPAKSDGKYRSGEFKIETEEKEAYWFPTADGTSLAGGDSGGASFTWVNNSYALVGVHSEGPVKYIPGKPKKGWDWVSECLTVSDAPIKKVWGRIVPLIAPTPVWQNWFRITDGGGLKSPITAIQPRPGHIDLFVTGNDGGIYSTYFEASVGWQKWFRIGTLQVAGQSRITALATRPDHIDLFVKNKLGGVASTYFEPNGGWRPWFAIPGLGGRKPGLNVAALQPFPGHIDLFTVGPNGKVMSTYFEANGGWRPWFQVNDMTAAPFSEVTALLTSRGQIQLYVSGTEGGVYLSLHSRNANWSPWVRVGALEMLPGSPITALETFPDHIDLFALDKSGHLQSTYDGKPWFTIAGLDAIPGTRVAALPTRQGHLDIFAVGADGRVRSTFHEPEGGWRSWFTVSNLTSTPGATVTALGTRPGHIDLFAPGTDSGVYSTFHR